MFTFFGDAIDLTSATSLPKAFPYNTPQMLLQRIPIPKLELRLFILCLKQFRPEIGISASHNNNVCIIVWADQYWQTLFPVLQLINDKYLIEQSVAKTTVQLPFPRQKEKQRDEHSVEHGVG